ncbi:MAG: sarcosine oxidase subunit delta [Pseudoruegeria sp.]
MRIICPLCGERDSREFSYTGDAQLMNRPAADAGPDEWHAYLHLRDNPAGVTKDLWHHGSGCGSWVVVTRNTVTHEVLETELAKDVKAAGGL